jgi:hypothetical protein
VINKAVKVGVDAFVVTLWCCEDKDVARWELGHGRVANEQRLGALTAAPLIV